MKHSIIFLLAIICLYGCGKINEQFDSINERLDNLENTTIASINQQIASINTSISNLEETDTELRGYITNLQNTATELQNSINTTNDKIDRVESELKADIASTKDNLSADILAAKNELLNNLTALRTEMQGKLDLINISISNLQDADVNLGLRIDQLRTYTDTAIDNTKDWASATFSTLEQYNQTVTEIAGIKANITAINTAMSELETRINNKIANDIAQAVSTLEGELQQQAADITQAYKDAISTAKGEIESAYTQAIQTAISNSESSMQSWVNDKLTGYYTIAQTDAKLATLKEALESDLATQKQFLEGKISTLETTLTAKIEANGTLIAGLQTQINSLSGDLSSLAETVATNSQNISQNSTKIATNAHNIATNASDIDECERLIAENNSLIQTNTTAIGENTSAIISLQSRLTTDEQNIATNASNISKNASDIATNAELIATNAAAIANNAIAISTNATKIANLQNSLATAITDITTAYTTAISTAITENNGVINAKIAADIATAQAALQQQIDAITTRINNLESRVGSLEETVADILNTVQDIVVIPTYSDGSVACMPGNNDFYFEVLPSGAATRLAGAGKDIFVMKAVYTQTKAAVSFVSMPISSVKADGDILIITASGANLMISPGVSASASLTVVSGSIAKTTGYFPLSYIQTPTEVVDLGLSVKWSSYNLGKDGLVNSPEEVGEYYAWGETESKNDYSWATYKWGNRTSYIWKYGAIDGKTLLDSEDDAAQVILGGDWRMPTKEEWDEILNPDNCDCIRTSLNGVDGLKFTSKKEGYTGNWIFIPAAGRMSGTELQKIGVDMYCWASSVCSNPTSQAWDIKLWSDGDPFIDKNVRYYGNTIRPVYDPIAHQNISLSRSSLELAIGTSFMLSAIPSPENSTDVTFQWSTSNPSIASVDGGTVTAVSPGSAVITVTAVESGKSANCTVRVKNENLMISVDLGLSVIWATCNLGASIPEEIGNHYAWGEAQPRPSGFGDWSKYKYGSSSTSMTKYNNSSSYGAVDNKSTLEMVDDAARTLLGGFWRMPTKAEFDELVNGCTKSWVDRNGVPGVLLTSKKNGANIFFPFNDLTQGENGYYWSSSLYTSIPYNAWEFLFKTDDSKYGTYYGDRFQGRSIRAVY